MSVNSGCLLIPFICEFLVFLTFQSDGSVNVHIDMNQTVQSEPRLRLVLAENLLRDLSNVIQRIEVIFCFECLYSDKSHFCNK